ncbi:MAG: hypothetical protein ACREIV_01945 [Planctomycetaceae bacterium]
MEPDSLQRIVTEGMMWINWMITVALFVAVLTWRPVRGKGLLAAALGIHALAGLGFRLSLTLLQFAERLGGQGGEFLAFYQALSPGLLLLTMLANVLHLIALVVLRPSIVPPEFVRFEPR